MCNSNTLLELKCNFLYVKHELNHCIYRVIQEGRSLFWEMMVSVIVRKTFIWTCVCFWIFTAIQLFDWTNSALWMVIKGEKMLQCTMQVRKLTVNFNATRVCGNFVWHFVRPSWSSSFFLWAAHSKCGQFFLSVSLCFVNFTFRPASQTSEKREGMTVRPRPKQPYLSSH